MTRPVIVVIVTYNSEAVIGDLVASLPAALAGVAHEVVVVDNGSRDDTVARLRECGVRVVESTNNGYAAGINLGVETGLSLVPDAGSTLILNPDLVLDPGSVATMLTALERPGVGIVAPRVREADGSLTWSLRRAPTLRRNLGLGRTRLPALAEWVNEEAEYAFPHEVDWALGAVLLVSTACHRALRGWDESFFLYSEETDFCLRAADAGFRTRYEPRAGAVHLGGGSGRSARTHAMQAVNRVRLYRRRHGDLAALAYLGLSVAGELSWWVRGNPHSLTAVRALLRPRSRPTELRAADRLLPR